MLDVSLTTIPSGFCYEDFPMRLIATLFVSSLLSGGALPTVSAALPPEVKKELSELNRELRPVTGMIRKKQVDEAKAIIQKVEDRIKELNFADDERDRSLAALKATCRRPRAQFPLALKKRSRKSSKTSAFAVMAKISRKQICDWIRMQTWVVADEVVHCYCPGILNGA